MAAARGFFVKRTGALIAGLYPATEAIGLGEVEQRVRIAFSRGRFPLSDGTVKSAGRGCFAYAASNPPAGALDRGVRMASRTR